MQCGNSDSSYIDSFIHAVNLATQHLHCRLLDSSLAVCGCDQGFRQWFLGTLNIPTQASSRKGLPVRVTFISRKPYGKKRKLTRQIANEEELFAMVQSLAGVQARKADFAQISLADQLQLVASDTDILVGGYKS